MRLWFLLCLSGCFSLLHAAAPAFDVLWKDGSEATLPVGENPLLEKILHQALRQAPAMIEAEIVYAQKDASRHRTILPYLPEVNMSYQSGGYHEIRQGLASDQRTRFGGSYNITAGHPLYHWGAYEAQKKLAFAQESIAWREGFIAYSKLVPELRASFNALIVEYTALKLLRHRIQSSVEKMEKIRQLAAQGTLSESALRVQEIEHRSLELSLAMATAKFERSLSQFRNKSGYLDLKAEDLPEDIALPAIDLEALTHLTRLRESSMASDSPAAELSRENLKAIDQLRTIYRSRQKPTFNIGGGIIQAPVAVNSKYELQTIFFVGVTGTWNLFDRRAMSDNIRSLSAQKRLVEIRLRSSVEDARVEALTALAMISIGLDSVKNREQSTALAREHLELAREQVQKGQANADALRLAEVQFLEVQSSALGDKADLLAAYHKLIAVLYLDPAFRHFSL